MAAATTPATAPRTVAISHQADGTVTVPSLPMTALQQQPGSRAVRLIHRGALGVPQQPQAPFGRPAADSAQRLLLQQLAGHDNYFSSWRAMTTRWIWLVPS
jgi:hypothetical protein